MPQSEEVERRRRAGRRGWGGVILLAGYGGAAPLLEGAG